MIKELIEGKNIGNLPDPFPFLSNNKIPRSKKSGDISKEYLEIYQQMEKSFLSIKEIKVNGILKPDFDPKLQDVIILNQNNTQVTTDKANKMEQKGPWKILNKKFIELTDSETKEKQLMEVLSLKGIELKVKIVEDDTKIEMILNKK